MREGCHRVSRLERRDSADESQGSALQKGIAASMSTGESHSSSLHVGEQVEQGSMNSLPVHRMGSALDCVGEGEEAVDHRGVLQTTTSGCFCTR